MTDDEWSQLMTLLRRTVQDPERRLTLFIDAPYLDYAARGEQAKSLFRALTPLPRNLLVTIGYSISKSLTLYGLRTGAFIGMSQDRGVLEEFAEVNGASARGVWTNVPRAGMRLCSILHGDQALTTRVVQEREELRGMLRHRATMFLKEAGEVGLELMPYRSGFFMSIPTPDPERLAAALAEEQLFVVPMELGIRLAISGIATHKIPGLAAIIKRSQQRLQT